MPCLQCFRATVDSKLYPFTILLILIIFKFIWQHHVPGNETYICFQYAIQKYIVMAAQAYLETHILLMIITNVNLMTQLLGCFWDPFERNKNNFWRNMRRPLDSLNKYTKFLQK